MSYLFEQIKQGKVTYLVAALITAVALASAAYQNSRFDNSVASANAPSAESKVTFEKSAASRLPTPTISRLPKQVKTNTYTVRGKTLPGARVTAIGGPYDLPPVTANASGRFSVKVPTRDALNQYQIKIEKDGQFAPAVTLQLYKDLSTMKAAAPAKKSK